MTASTVIDQLRDAPVKLAFEGAAVGIKGARLPARADAANQLRAAA